METEDKVGRIVGLIGALFLHTIFIIGVSHAGQIFFVDIVGLDYDRAVIFIVCSVIMAFFDLKIALKNI